MVLPPVRALRVVAAGGSACRRDTQPWCCKGAVEARHDHILPHMRQLAHGWVVPMHCTASLFVTLSQTKRRINWPSPLLSSFFVAVVDSD